MIMKKLKKSYIGKSFVKEEKYSDYVYIIIGYGETLDEFYCKIKRITKNGFCIQQLYRTYIKDAEIFIKNIKKNTYKYIK